MRGVFTTIRYTNGRVYLLNFYFLLLFLLYLNIVSRLVGYMLLVVSVVASTGAADCLKDSCLK